MKPRVDKPLFRWTKIKRLKFIEIRNESGGITSSVEARKDKSVIACQQIG